MQLFGKKEKAQAQIRADLLQAATQVNGQAVDVLKTRRKVVDTIHKSDDLTVLSVALVLGVSIVTDRGRVTRQEAISPS